ncbi:DUF4974 domain-containing protein [Flavihumibacter rivuli]|uniref:FecR family protein n=1 Tax=Flavihumibacter rivuli TaxID=2838156 RepID=UPI001BDE3810|nr:FecR domain-containing protein [Flavihumibacter rivuli]ULQ56016.1 DUF4974 domain-containing protein [Flavihumibacter rivuli]
MTENRLWELLAKKLSGEATVPELEELREILRRNPEWHYPTQTVTDLWFHHHQNSEDSSAAYDRHIARMQELGFDFPTAASESYAEDAFGTGSGRPWYRRPVMAWVGLLFIGLLGTWGYFQFKQAAKIGEPLAELPSEVSTRNGSKSKITLPDGTQVWLNAGSKLTYGKDFGATLREVTLTGEAYFDVVKNKEKPFLIHARNIDIRVLGTAFNVKSYPGDKTTETSLIRGSIEVSIHNRPKEKIILKPNEKLVVASEDVPSAQPATRAININKNPVPKIVVDQIHFDSLENAVVETAWMENKLIFRDESFEELASKMERWYGVTFRFEDEEIRQLRFSGIFVTENLQQALRALHITANFNYRIEKDLVIISR